jgi:hypothetical protein
MIPPRESEAPAEVNAQTLGRSLALPINRTFCLTIVFDQYVIAHRVRYKIASTIPGTAFPSLRGSYDRTSMG